MKNTRKVAKNVARKLVCYALIGAMTFSQMIPGAVISANPTADYTESIVTLSENEVIPQQEEAVQESLSIDEMALETEWIGAEAEGDLVPLTASEIKEGYSDYASYMTKHVLKIDGDEIVNGAVIEPTKKFQLSLEFRLSMAQMAAGGTQYYYKLPRHITIGNQGSAEEPITLYNSLRIAIGTYYIEDDVMYVSFPGYYDMVVAYFNMEASWDETENKAQISVEWNDETEHFNIDICDLSVAKMHSGYLTADDGGLYVDFKVKVWPETEGATVDNVTFQDLFTNDKLEIAEDTYGEDKAICLTRYNADKTVNGVEYYKLADVQDSTGFTITPVCIENGGYFEVTYRTQISFKERMEMDANGGGERFSNKAVVSYPYVDMETGQTHTLETSAVTKGEYREDDRWIFKEQGKETHTKYMSGETKEIVPYVITINKYRPYSLGGSIVQDEITGFVGGKVVYDINEATKNYGDTYINYVVVSDKEGTRTQQQKWVVLDATTYEQLKGLASAGADTALSRLRSDAALESALLNAINAEYSTSYTDFSDAVSLEYVFTDSASDNFVWIMPHDTTPTTYTIHYNTIVDAAVGTFKNTASLWYTEFEAVPEGPGAWSRPVKKVMNATKTNDGVYIGEDGNYYVDYKITVGLEAGSAAFEDIVVKEMFPCYKIPLDGIGDVPVFDWLAGVNADEVDITTLTQEQNRAMVDPLVKVSTTSNDPAVQEVVRNSFSGFHYETKGGHVATGYESGEALDYYLDIRYASSEPGHGGTISYDNLPYQMAYKGEGAPAGQFLVKKEFTQDPNRVNLKKGETYSFGGMMIWLGDLPGTEEGYDIDIEFTLQVNPLLVKKIPELLEASGEQYITNTNKAKVYTSFMHLGRPVIGLYGEYGFIQSLSSPYWIGMNDTAPGITKNVVPTGNGVGNAAGVVTYELKVNPDQGIKGENVIYEVTDILGMAGLKYVNNSIVAYDKDGKVVYSQGGTPAVDASYTEHATKITVEKTSFDDQSNSFVMKLDNRNGLFTVDEKLMPLTIQYQVDISAIATDVDVMNDAALSKLEEEQGGNGLVRTGLGEAHAEYSVDKALDKQIVSEPTRENDFLVDFYVDINPQSDNAYQLKNIQPGEKFTVRDELGSELVLDLEDVKVYRYQGDVFASETDITTKCKISYDGKIMDVEIPVTNSDDRYRIVYSAYVMTPASEYVRYDNKVSVLGTDIKEDVVERKTWIYAFNEGTYAVKGAIKLHKYDVYDINKGIRAKFNLYRLKDGRWQQITTGETGYEPIETDANGDVLIENKMLNQTAVTLIEANTWYKLVEIETEAGYVLDSVPVYYYVSDTGEHIKEADIPKGIEEYQLVKLKSDVSVNQETPVIYIQNQKFGFDIRKTDVVTGGVLKGAEFKLYTDEACTQLVQTAVTNEEGIASFRNIEMDTSVSSKELWLKETKAPEDYVLDDTPCKLTVYQGRVKSAIYDQNNTVPITDTGHLSLLDITNTNVSARLLITKTVTYGDDSRKEQSFAFTARIYDADGNTASEAFPATVTDVAGTTTTLQYKSGSIFYLKHGESMLISDVPEGYTYKVSEVYDQHYYTSVKVEDTVNAVDNKEVDSTVAEGTFENGNMDTVAYTNEATDSLCLVKTAETTGGEAMELPDGLTFTISNSELGKFAEVVWDAVQKKFNLEYKANQRIELDNTIENGFRITGIKTGGNEEDYVIVESNAEIDGKGFYARYEEPGMASIVNGALKIKKSRTDGNDLHGELTNYYSSEFVTAKPVVKKQYNKAIPLNTFRFGLYEQKSGGLLQTAYADADGNVEFEELRFVRPATYKYILKEIPPEGASWNSIIGMWEKDGVAYSAQEVVFEVVVEKNADGELEVTNMYYDDEEVSSVTIENTYIATGKWQPEVKKTLENKRPTYQQFGFTLTEYTDSSYTTEKAVLQDKMNQSAEENSNTAIVAFDEIEYTYDDIGTHYYIVQEYIPQDAADNNNQKDGIVYDDTQYKIAVEVADNDDGTLKVTPNYNNGENQYVEIKNAYEPSGSVTFRGNKRMLFDDLLADTYSFELTEYTDASRATVKTTENGTPIRYTFGHEAGTYDETLGYSEGAIEYPTLKFGFEDIGTHYYILKEVIPQDAPEDMRYDSAERKVVVTVADNQDGTLSVTEHIDNGKSYTFVNYRQQEIKLKFNGTKALYGRELKDSEFAFWAYEYVSQTGSTAAPIPQRSGMIGLNRGNGEIEFAELLYTLADVGKTYTYYIMEGPGGGNTSSALPGITYDPMVYQVQVVIGLDEEQNLKADVKKTVYQANTEVTSLDFNNTYDAQGEIIFTATKLLANKEIQNQEFEFGIYEDETLLAKGTNDADGKVTFEPVKFYIDGEVSGVESYIGKHTYTIKEIIPTQPKQGYVYDKTEYTVVVEATDDGFGKIEVNVLEGASAGDNPAGITYQIQTPENKNATFENEYEAKGSLTLEGTKILTGRNLKEKEFTFTAVEYKLDGIKKQPTGRTFKGTNDAAGKIVFDSISYVYTKKQDDTGVYYYHITEDKVADSKGIKCDEKEIVYECMVAHVGDGKLEANGVLTNQEIMFENAYVPEAELTITVTKHTETELGEPYEDQTNTFGIEIYEVGADKQEKPVTKIAVKAGETIKATPIKYTIEDVGTHRYKIVEETKEKPGYQNDDTQYFINVDVINQETEYLSVVVKDDNGAVIAQSKEGSVAYSAEFTNTYSAEGKVTFKGTKKIEHADKLVSGYKMGDDDFTFSVYELKKKGKKGKKAVATGKVKADGSIVFEPIEYTLEDVGTHQYVICEDKNNKTNCVLSTAKDVKVTVKVADRGDGRLKVDVTYENGKKSAQFINNPTGVVIDKVTESGRLLPGAKLQIFDDKENAVAEFTSGDQSTYIYGLKINTTYTLVETAAPAGYLVAENIKFMIDGDGNVYLVREKGNKKVDRIVMKDYDIPNKTGDSAGVGAAMALMLAAFLGILFFRKKRFLK